MQIQIDERNQITGYATVGGFPNGIEVEATEEFEESFAPGKYLYDNGIIVENPNYVEPVNNETIQEESHEENIQIANMLAKLEETDRFLNIIFGVNE